MKEKEGKLIQGKILVKQDDAETKTSSGIILPGVEKPHQGIVVVVGPSTERMETLCKVGDRIFFSDHSGTAINLDEEDIGLVGEYLLMDWSGTLLYK